jgi:hypothetical protein
MAKVKLYELKTGEEFMLGENRYKVAVRYKEDEEQIKVINLTVGKLDLEFPRNLIVDLTKRRKK